MKKLFTIAAALVLSAVAIEPAVAQTTESVVQPTKKEIRAAIRECYENIVRHANNHLPVLIVEEELELYNWFEGLDDKSQDYFLKVMSKEKKRAAKLMTEEQIEYCNYSVHLIVGESSLESDLDIMTDVYMDAVYESCVLKEDVESGSWYLMDFMIYLVLRGVDPSEMLANWGESNSQRYNYVNEAIDGMTYDGMMLDYFKLWFDEDYSQMSEEELVEAYILHKECAVAWCDDESKIMESGRHIFASYIIRSYASEEILDKADDAWEAENHELAVRYYEVIKDLIK